MEYHKGKCRHEAAPGILAADGPCRVALDDEHLVIAREGEEPLSLYYSDIDRLTAEAHEVRLTLFGGSVYTIYFLGTYYGQFVADLRRKRSAQLVRNLLMLDAEPQKEFKGAYSFQAPDGRAHADRTCTITLYRSTLVVEPENHDPWNLAYNDITAMRFDPGPYHLDLRLDLGERVTFSMLGSRFSELEQEIRRLTAALRERTARLLGERLTSATGKSLAAVAGVLLQGQAVPRPAVEAAAPGLWPDLEALLFTGENGEVDAERQAGFGHLSHLARPEQVYVGLREPFASTEENPRPLFWFIIAYPQHRAMAVEVTNESGYATYLYRIQGPVEQAVRELNRAMIALNFRRDVISASEKEIHSERMARYRVALRKLDRVHRLRSLFLGRVAHTTEAAWRRGVDSLLNGDRG
ncbi:MAG: hypothetical protein ACOY94_17740 [Bacillota bacterium]